MMAPLQSPILTARVVSGTLNIDHAAAAFARDHRRPRGWPIPPGVSVSRLHPVVGGWPNLIPDSFEDSEGVIKDGVEWSRDGLCAVTCEGDRILDIAERIGVSARKLERFRVNNPAVAAAMDAKRGGPRTTRRIGDATIIRATGKGDSLEDIARRVGLNVATLHRRRREDSWLTAEMDRRMV